LSYFLPIIVLFFNKKNFFLGFVFVVVAKDDGPDAPPRPPPAFAHDRG